MTTGERTSWKQRREFEERLARGYALTVSETASLIEDADAAERSTAILEALEEALESQLGLVVIDCTTDDDEGEICIELVPAEDIVSERLDPIGE